MFFALISKVRYTGEFINPSRNPEGEISDDAFSKGLLGRWEVGAIWVMGRSCVLISALDMVGGSRCFHFIVAMQLSSRAGAMFADVVSSH